MNSEEAKRLQPGDRILSVGSEHYAGLYGFTTNGTIRHVTDDFTGILIARDDSGADMWVATKYVTAFAYEGKRRQWRAMNDKAVREEQVRNGFRSGPYEKSAAPVRDLDPARRYSKHSLRAVHDIIVKTASATGSKRALSRIFRGIGLAHFQAIQPWHYDVVHRACEDALAGVDELL